MAEYTIKAKILVGGARYATNNINDYDYLTIVEEDVKFKRVLDEKTNIDYLYYGEKFLKELLSGDAYHFNLPFVLIDLSNQNDYITTHNIFERQGFVKTAVKNWITIQKNAILKNYPQHKRIYYAFVFMYYIKNGEHKLSETQQEVVNKIHNREEISETDIDEFVVFYELDEDYRKSFISMNNFVKRKRLDKINKS